MRALLTIRDLLRSLYADYDYIIRPISKFVLAFLMLLMLQGKVGYFERFSSVIVIAGCSAVCMFLPYGGVSLICGIFLIADMAAVSYAMAGFAAILLCLIFALYYGFRPGTGILMALVPMLFAIKIPFLLPVILGMSMGIAAIVPAVFGILIWRLIEYFSVNASALSAASTSDIIDTFTDISHEVLADRYMLTAMLAFSICIVVVSVISKSSLNHCWTISVFAGIIILAIFFIYADISCGGALITDLAGIILSLFLVLIYEMVIYSVDYKATEHLKFEDDDYYYFVKAIPKIKPLDEDERRD